ncbi:glycosyltransferase [Alkalitalea saponilacus]|uniref:Glycosyl transferases group 1 n=1 Tax=Alkalitalea saponilacus TaxID=889453 RepID=A0A1T5HS49_9BACT|nr:glycosyltransferase family 1 protein [Alkalitalea saponilacus]ASB48293.1 hypothetical protein CDL62_03615 [Alkalitalea saponilacus]SKC23516.1 hypothetical protein SAMN03080601_02791 [Alkalitalea saponilacus]
MRAVFNYLLTHKRVPDKRRFFADYYAQMNRQYLSYYHKKETTGDYIFFAGALWKKEGQTNQYRANYIRACKNMDGVKFEGGFAPRSRNDIPGFEDLIMEEKVPMSDYLTKIKDSAVVFNTPVIMDCHGWKLGEFMALGKAMIATPIKNLLPVPLEHGKNIHFINGGEDEVQDAVKKLTTDHAYRQQIENNIKEYFNANVTPERSVEIVCEKAGFRIEN